MLRVLLFTALAVQTVLARCDPGWSKFGHRCIHVNPVKVTWNTAEEFCKAFGGHLVQVDSQAKHDFIVNQLKVKKISFAWIGGYKYEDWKWIATGHLMYGYTNWGKVQPDNYRGIENCLSISVWFNYKWNDADCNLHYGFVCEKRNSK